MSRIPMCTFALLCSAAVGLKTGIANDYSVGVTPVGHQYGATCPDGSDQYSSGIERFCLGVKDCIRGTRLQGYKRLQKKHRGLLYPECPPYCSPTHGYHHTQWRRFPEDCEYIWSNAPGEVIYEAPATASPMMLPLTPTPAELPPATDPALAPPAQEQYFPEPAPIIRPADPGTAPPAPAADPTAPPAPPPESDLDPANETFLPARPSAEAASYEEPALLQIN